MLNSVKVRHCNALRSNSKNPSKIQAERIPFSFGVLPVKGQPLAIRTALCKTGLEFLDGNLEEVNRGNN